MFVWENFWQTLAVVIPLAPQYELDQGKTPAPTSIEMAAQGNQQGKKA